jgi:hypothetical protein
VNDQSEKTGERDMNDEQKTWRLLHLLYEVSDALWDFNEPRYILKLR